MSIAYRGVSFTYPGTSLGVFDIDLTIEPGELMAVIGASGSGKTTLLKLLAGFLVPDRGQIYLDGQDVTELPVRARQLGIVFQSYALFPHMCAWENVAYPLKLRGESLAARRQRAFDTLKLIGLEGFETRLPSTLSGGQQQRVALGRALVFAPRALLLDEPLSALDAALRVAMRDEITRVQRAANIATLHVTHDQEEALSIADRVAVMERGRVIQVDTPRDLYDRPKRRSVAAFVGQANLLDGTVTAMDRVQVSFGQLRCAVDGGAVGEPVTVLVRPERLLIGPAADRENSFACQLERDRFLGSLRRFDVRIGPAVLTGETTYRGTIDRIGIPPEAVQLLPPTTSQPS